MKKQKKQKRTGQRKGTMRRTQRKEPTWTGETAFASQRKTIGRVHVTPEALGYPQSERVRTGTVQPSSPFDVRVSSVDTALDELGSVLATLEHRLEPVLGAAPPTADGPGTATPTSDVRVLGVLDSIERRLRSLHAGAGTLTDRLVI